MFPSAKIDSRARCPGQARLRRALREGWIPRVAELDPCFINSTAMFFDGSSDHTRATIKERSRESSYTFPKIYACNAPWVEQVLIQVTMAATRRWDSSLSLLIWSWYVAILAPPLPIRSATRPAQSAPLAEPRLRSRAFPEQMHSPPRAAAATPPTILLWMPQQRGCRKGTTGLCSRVCLQLVSRSLAARFDWLCCWGPFASLPVADRSCSALIYISQREPISDTN
jgi:hypothetical protein